MFSGSFVHAIGPARCCVGEGSLPDRSVGMKPEKWRWLKLTHAWQLRTMTDKNRLLRHRQYKLHTVV